MDGEEPENADPVPDAMRHGSLLTLPALLLVAACATSAPREPLAGMGGDAFAADEVVARVGGVAITLGDLMLRYASLPAPTRALYARGGGLRAFLDDTVASMAIAREAQALGLEDDRLFAQLMALRREEVLRDLHARRTVLAGIDEATLRRRYEEQRDARFTRPAVARVRHLLVTPVTEPRPFHDDDEDAVGDAAARAKAERLRREIAAGAAFSDVARRSSEDASATAGGDLGWVRPGQLVAEADRAVFALAPGELSGVIASPLGYHLLLVEDRLPAGVVPFAAVRELLFQELVGEQAERLAPAARQDRDRLVGRYAVELYPERLP
jgi:hypothetical protein